MTLFDIAVIGLGMIGSAALRALSAGEPALRVAGVGPAEPGDWARSAGPFASHDDHARITRISDPDRSWATLARRSIDAYPTIATCGGIGFHHPSGHVRLGHRADHAVGALAAAIGRDLAAPVERLGSAELAEATGLHEGGGAGWINLRALVAAQLAGIAAQGATLVRAAVTAIRRDAGGFAIRLERQAHTTVLAELPPAQAAALAEMPSLIWPLAQHALLSSVYTTPPARYPDGRWYLKIGGPLHAPRRLDSPAAVQVWFQSPGNPAEIAALQAVLRDLIRELAVVGWVAKPCMNTYTAHNRPYVDQLAPGVFVCTGGCGAAAKSADAIGDLGARLAGRGCGTTRCPPRRSTPSTAENRPPAAPELGAMTEDPEFARMVAAAQAYVMAGWDGSALTGRYAETSPPGGPPSDAY